MASILNSLPFNVENGRKELENIEKRTNLWEFFDVYCRQFNYEIDRIELCSYTNVPENDYSMDGYEMSNPTRITKVETFTVEIEVNNKLIEIAYIFHNNELIHIEEHHGYDHIVVRDLRALMYIGTNLRYTKYDWKYKDILEFKIKIANRFKNWNVSKY